MAQSTRKTGVPERRSSVGKFRILAAFASVATAVAVVSVPALAGGAKIVPFKASFSGTATTKLTGSRVDVTARAAGTGTLVGKSTLSGAGVGTKPADGNCVPFSGPGKIVTSTKLTLKFVVQPASSGCAGEDQNQVTFTGSAKFLGGTGKFKLARGSFTFGAFTAKFTGSLRV
jgi:hypothetical protein